MGARGNGRAPIPAMNGGFSGAGERPAGGPELGGGEGANDGLVQVFEALVVAESTIKQQMKENNILKSELRRLTPEIERYKLEAKSAQPATISVHDHSVDPRQTHSSISAETEENRTRWVDNGSSVDPRRILVNGSSETSSVNYQFHESNKVNGSLLKMDEAQATVDNAGPSQFSTPSYRSLSPNRRQVEGDPDPTSNATANSVMPISEFNPNILWKQQLALKVRDNEEEIARLRNHLADYSMKEAQIRNEKYALEARISNMRRAFDQQQEDLVDAASKAISYRQEIIEENIRLTYALQAAQVERSTYISSLVPFLSEYGFQPAAHDAYSIVSGLKVLFTHMQEKLLMIEDKIKDSQYLLTPWQTDSNSYGYAPQSPSHPLSAQYKNNLEIVPQPAYPHGHAHPHAQLPISAPPNFQSGLNLEVTENQTHRPGSSGVGKNQEHGTLERIPPFVHRNAAESTSTRADQSDSDFHFSSETKDQNLSFKDLVGINKLDDSEPSTAEHERELNVHWAPGNSPLSAAREDPMSYPYLPPVLEEPGSSFSEAAEDDPLPAIDDLRISGEPFPGRMLQANGYSINGTKSCNFEWVRYLEDGSVHYIDGAKQPSYLVTADDVNSYLAIEVQPLDDRMRKGELVVVFANDKKKITCDAEMQDQLRQTLFDGHISYQVSSSTKFLDIWESAVLAIKREGYSIKSSRGVVTTEKFKSNTNITIPYGQPTEFHIQDGNNTFILKTEVSSQLRDTIVLTMRLFKNMALEKRKGRKKVLFF